MSNAADRISRFSLLASLTIHFALLLFVGYLLGHGGFLAGDLSEVAADTTPVIVDVEVASKRDDDAKHEVPKPEGVARTEPAPAIVVAPETLPETTTSAAVAAAVQDDVDGTGIATPQQPVTSQTKAVVSAPSSVGESEQPDIQQKPSAKPAIEAAEWEAAIAAQGPLASGTVESVHRTPSTTASISTPKAAPPVTDDYVATGADEMDERQMDSSAAASDGLGPATVAGQETQRVSPTVVEAAAPVAAAKPEAAAEPMSDVSETETNPPAKSYAKLRRRLKPAVATPGPVETKQTEASAAYVIRRPALPRPKVELRQPEPPKPPVEAKSEPPLEAVAPASAAIAVAAPEPTPAPSVSSPAGQAEKAPDTTASIETASAAREKTSAPLMRRASRAEVKAYSGRLRSFIYARRPKNEGVVGTVVIGFALSPEGKLLYAQLRRSCGDEDLDRQSLEAVRGAEPYPVPPAGMTAGQLSFTIPFRFR